MSTDTQLLIDGLRHFGEVYQAQRDEWKARAEKAEAKLFAVEALFAGGPDTPCRTAWRNGVECVEVPMDDLRAALTRGGDES